MVYIPYPKKRLAKKVAKILFTEKLAACANILGPSLTLFQWKGKVSTTREWILILKTTEAKFLKLERRIIALHPYSCPCVAKIAVSRLNVNFQNWLVQSMV